MAPISSPDLRTVLGPAAEDQCRVTPRSAGGPPAAARGGDVEGHEDRGDVVGGFAKILLRPLACRLDDATDGARDGRLGLRVAHRRDGEVEDVGVVPHVPKPVRAEQEHDLVELPRHVEEVERGHRRLPRGAVLLEEVVSEGTRDSEALLRESSLGRHQQHGCGAVLPHRLEAEADLVHSSERVRVELPLPSRASPEDFDRLLLFAARVVDASGGGHRLVEPSHLLGAGRRVVCAQLLEADRAIGQEAAEERVRVADVCDDENVPPDERHHGGGGAAVDGLAVCPEEVAVFRAVPGAVLGAKRRSDAVVGRLEGARHRLLRLLLQGGDVAEKVLLERRRARPRRDAAVFLPVPVEHAPDEGAAAAAGHEGGVLVLLRRVMPAPAHVRRARVAAAHEAVVACP
mmetsp:Transcript_33899/g.108870  ORF Transcript_33899/g.108870 Transcript_33899/m.108870 type:complete len:402 (-) Transcript_33899:190-1395(-)